jgi:hypothetical protein
VVPLSQGRPVTSVPVHAGADVEGWPATDPVLLDDTHGARVTIGWAASHYCGPAVDVDHLRLRLPGLDGDYLVRGFGRTYCEPGERGRSPITVGPVAPTVYKPGDTRSAYAPIRASGLPATAPAGRPVDFRVTLTAPRTIVLDPCPDYTIEAFNVSGTKSTPTTWSYALNCAEIPTRDDQGRPVLRAGVPVTFAMQAPTLAAGQYKFIWQLEAGEAPTGRLLTVGPAHPTASVTGWLLPAGSTSPGRPRFLTGTITIRQQASGAVVQTVATDPKGHYTVRLAPGTYLLSATSPTYKLRGGSCTSVAVQIRNGQTLQRDLHCQVP